MGRGGSEAEWAGKSEIRPVKFLAAGEQHKGTVWPTPAFKKKKKTWLTLNSHHGDPHTLRAPLSGRRMS